MIVGLYSPGKSNNKKEAKMIEKIKQINYAEEGSESKLISNKFYEIINTINEVTHVVNKLLSNNK